MPDTEIPLARAVTDIIADAVELSRRRILDVGSGGGGLVRWLAQQGAGATGLETQQPLVAEARAREPVADEDYVVGRGEALPFAAHAFDAVIFSFSLHHVPEEAMRAALGEAGRVARADGTVLIVEPVADGDYFEVVRMVDDETRVRRLALEALHDHRAHGLVAGPERRYRIRHVFESPESMFERLVRVDPAREALIARQRDELERRFFSCARRLQTGYAFDMEVRSNVLFKPASRPV